MVKGYTWLVVLLGFIVSVGVRVSTDVFAEEEVDFSITVAPSLSLSVSSNAVNLSINPVAAGAFGKTFFTVSSATNNMYGYTLNMTNGTSYLESTTVNPTTGTKLHIETLSTEDLAESTFSNATTAAEGLNKWGIATINGNYNINSTSAIYNPVLTTATAIKDTNTNNTTADITSIVVASNLNLEIPAGVYSSTFNFQMVAKVLDPTLYYIIYNSNGGSGTMNYSTVAYEDTITLSTNTFTAPTGYVFDSWASSAAGAGPYYEDGGSFTAPASTSGETYKVLYANWKPTGTPTPTGGETGEGDGGGVGTGVTLQRAYEMAYSAMHKGMYEETTAGSNTYQYIDSWNGGTYQGEGRDVRFLIQDMTPEICVTATDIGSTALVLDIRDQTSYRIVKAADGRCWMQDNLALDLTDSNVQTTMINNPSYTNADAASLTSLFSGNRTNGGNYATAGVSNWTSSYYGSYSAPLINTSSIIVVPQGSSDSLKDLANTESWKVGVYYNYCAASAGSYCYGNGTSYSTTDSTAVDKANTAIDAEYDICPSNWRLPTSSNYDAVDRPDGGEYRNLYDHYSGKSGTAIGSKYANYRIALRFPLSGELMYGKITGQGAGGDFWSSTYHIPNRGSSMHFLNITTVDIDPSYGNGRIHGYSVRCIAR